MEFKGKITWLGELKSGTSNKGKEWECQEFLMEELNPEKEEFKKRFVGKANTKITPLLKRGIVATATFSVSANYWEKGERWFGTNDVYGLNIESAPTPAPQPESDMPF